MKITGVIANWRFNEGRIIGVCLMHTDTKYAGEHSITTSEVNTIWMDKGRRYVSTRNSVYLLID